MPRHVQPKARKRSTIVKYREDGEVQIGDPNIGHKDDCESTQGRYCHAVGPWGVRDTVVMPHLTLEEEADI